MHSQSPTVATVDASHPPDRSSIDYWIALLDPAVFADVSDDQRLAAAEALRNTFHAELEAPRYRPNLRLRHALVDDGRTVKQLARDVGLSHVSVSGVFTGRIGRPTERVKQMIADGLGRSVNELFDADEAVPV